MLVREVASNYFDWLGKHRSEATLRYYSGRLVAFIHRFGDAHFDQIDPWEIEEYFVTVNRWRIDDKRPGGKKPGDSKAPDTVRANIIAVEMLQQFAIKLNVLSTPFDVPEKPDGVKRVRLPTPEEVEAIKANASPSFGLIYEALRICGANPGELAGAMISDWDRMNDSIELRRNAVVFEQKKRSIRVGGKLGELLRKSIGKRGEGPIFLSPRGRAWTTNSLSCTFRRARDQAGLDDSIVLVSAKHEHAQRLKKIIRSAQDQMDL